LGRSRGEFTLQTIANPEILTNALANPRSKIMLSSRDSSASAILALWGSRFVHPQAFASTAGSTPLLYRFSYYVHGYAL
jgi:hypothetical protein